MTEILLRYHEIAIKGDNRGWFEERLAKNARKLVKRALTGSAEEDSETEAKIETTRIHGRILLKAPLTSEVQEVLQNRLFGLSSYSPMVRVETNLEAIRNRALEEFKQIVEKHGLPASFQVRSRRSDKALPENSMEIDRFVGAAIHDAFPSMKVDLKNPEFTLGIEVRFQESFIWTEKVSGQGGLPVGCNASVLTLLSGGLDSPVAAIQTMRRGTLNHFVHFYGTPFVGEEVLDKILDLVKVANRYQPDPQPLHIIPFGKIQEKIALVTPPKIRTLLYRRMMVRIADELAKKLGAMALITGESMGQVASQTIENIGTVNSVAKLPILRPLISMDKDEIIERARKWGSYDISIRPATDCCTLFADRHPTLRSRADLIEEQEQKFSVDDLVREAMEGATLSWAK